MTNTMSASHQDDAEMTIRDGAELKRVLRVAGYSQRELADYIGYSRSYVNAVCNRYSPLTLRVVEGVRHRLGDELFILAIKRARQVEVDEQREYEKRMRFNAMEAEYQRQQAQLREEQRRQAAMERLHQEIGSTTSITEVRATVSISDAVDDNGGLRGISTDIDGDDDDSLSDTSDTDVDPHGSSP